MRAAGASQDGSAIGAMDEYHLAEQIGEGSFGKVFKGRRRYTSQIVALKLINKHGKSEKDMRNLRQVPSPAPGPHATRRAGADKSILKSLVLAVVSFVPSTDDLDARA